MPRAEFRLEGRKLNDSSLSSNLRGLKLIQNTLARWANAFACLPERYYQLTDWISLL